MKKLFLFLGCCFVAFGLSAQTKYEKSAKEEIAENRFLSGSNYLDYDNYPAPENLTKAPQGYVLDSETTYPFVIKSPEPETELKVE